MMTFVREKNVREICRTLFLCIASFNLGVSSELLFLGILFLALFVYLPLRGWLFSQPKASPPRYKKTIAYLGIVPCAIWWVLTPSVDYGMSPYIVYIPAWYLLFLAWLQKRSVGNGAYEVFVAFNGVAALFMGLFQAPRPCVALGVAGLLLVAVTYARPRTALYKHLLFVLLFMGMGAAAIGGWQYWKSHRHYDGRWERDFAERNRIMGFDPVMSLGSFSNNYTSRYNDQVVLRVWDSLAPEYLRAAVYEKYVAGLWKLPAKAESKIYPQYYRVDYAVFELADSVTRKPGVKSVWVQSAFDNFGYLFADPRAVGVAAKNADSLDYYASGIFAGANGNRGDWYYYVPPAKQTLFEIDSAGARDSLNLQIGVLYREFVDSVARVMELPSDTSITEGYPDSLAYHIRQYFVQNFKYSLVVPGVREARRQSSGTRADPLVVFWNAKQGYCEYYATLATLLFRHFGIPARYVSGFAHPERVEGRPYALFRRRHSHAWVEVYAHDQWLTFDPTPPIMVMWDSRSFWWQIKWESLKGHFAYAFHVLREGEWRRVVDSWQSMTAGVLDSPYFYAGLVLMVILVALFKVRRVFSRRRGQPKGNRAAHWIAILDRAERTLLKAGYTRAAGETVSAFTLRVQKKLQDEDCLEAVEMLRQYEKNRWRR